MGRRNLADLRGALPLTVAAGTAAAAFAFLALAGVRAPARSAPAPAPAPPVSVHHHPPAGLVTRVAGVRHLRVRVAAAPESSASLAWGGGELWTPGFGGVLRTSPETLQASTSQLPEAGLCVDSQLAYGAGGIWATNGDCGDPGAVFEFDRRTRLRRTIRLPASAVGLGIWNGRVWVTTDARQGSRWAAVRIDPSTGRATAVGGPLDSSGDTAAGYGVSSVIPVGGGRFWTVANDGGVVLMALEPSGRVAGTVIGGGATPTGLAFGDGAVWAGFDRNVVRLDPRTGEATGIDLRPRSGPVAVAFGQGTVWIATSGYEVYGFRPGSKSMTQVDRLTFAPTTMLYAAGYLWATDGQVLARIGPLKAR